MRYDRSTRSLSILSAVCAAVLVVLAVRLGAQTPAVRSIVGVVTSDSAGSHGVGDVDVAIPALNLAARTNWLGEFRFARVPLGTYVVEARRIGYRPVSDSARVVATGDAHLDFVIDRKAVTLDSVVSTAMATRTYISPALRGFEERMNAHSGGSFIAESTLRKNEDHKLPEVLTSRLGGLSLHRSPRGDETYAFSSRSGSAQCGVFQGCKGPDGRPLQYNQFVPQLCYVTVFMDGVRFGLEPKFVNRDNPPPNLNSLNVHDLAGVEYYPGSASVPMQFANDNPCGTLLLWTREK